MGQGKAEFGALAWDTLHADRAAVSFHDALGDRQSQARAAGGLVAGFLAAVEAVEDVRQVGGGNTLTAILDGDVDGLPIRFGLDENVASAGGMAEGIADQVIEDPTDSLDIHADRVDARGR